MNRREMLKALFGGTAAASATPAIIPQTTTPAHIGMLSVSAESEAGELIKRLVKELQSVATRGANVPLA